MAIPYFTSYPPPPPARFGKRIQPKGVPTKTYFYLGGIGASLAAIGVLFLGIIFMLALLEIELAHKPLFWRSLFVLISLLLTIGCIIMGLGFYGFYHNYGCVLGVVALIFSIIACLFWIVLSAVIVTTPFEVTYAESEAMARNIAGIFLLGGIVSGIMLILQGVTVYSTRFS